MSDSSSTRVHRFLELHSRSYSLRSNSLTIGNRVPNCKIVLIPNKVKQVNGLTVLSGCKGSPNLWKTEATAKLRAQSRHYRQPAVL